MAGVLNRIADQKEKNTCEKQYNGMIVLSVLCD